MDHSSAIPAAHPSEQVCVAPLTQTKRDGTPYCRFPDVEAQISAVLLTLPASWEPKSLKSETLVYLIRWLWKQNDQSKIGKLIDQLGRRIAQIARDFSSGFNQLEAEEFAIRIGETVNVLIFADVPSRKSEFLEIAFRKRIEQLALNLLEQHKNSHAHVVGESWIDASSDQENNLINSQVDGTLPPDEIVANKEAIRVGLAAISNPRHRDAVILRYLEGWPIFDDDPQIPTLCTHFGKSSRQIGNWLAKACEEMRVALRGAP